LSPAAPELLDVDVAARNPRDHRHGVEAVVLAPAGKELPQLLERPVNDAIRGVVQHLPDDLPTDACVRAALDLDERRHGVLVEEQVVDRPAAGRVLVVGERSLAANKYPAARRIVAMLVTSEQAGELRDQRLENILGLVWAHAHFDQLVVAP
jgi:hypothetical protein